MSQEATAFATALAGERARNARQVSAFRLFAILFFVAVQLFFQATFADWAGAPMGPMLGYAAASGLVWRLRKRFDAWSQWTGYSIAVIDMPMAFWLITAGSRATVEAGTPELADGVRMILPIANAGFIALASLALDSRQTVVAACTAIALQWIALAGIGHDYTFLTMVNAFTAL